MKQDRTQKDTTQYCKTLDFAMAIFSRTLALVAAIIFVSPPAAVAIDSSSRDDDFSTKSPKVLFSVEKGYKCHGGGDMSAMKKECEGGMAMEFTASAKSMDILKEIAHGIHDHLKHNFLPDADDLLPTDDGMEEAMVGVDEGQQGVDFSKTFEFGGMAKVEWGCNVTYEMRGRKFSKRSKCGFKGSAGAGTKEPDELIQRTM
jgi:hypothetical protein